eukprot:GFUD01113205.1.p1 GENE.GFUD01113205.1~~GFUD01113205.1.p1  ORF type:complete len:114 (-),score=29.75 GFUD01113205.1:94-435(-)
MFEPNSNLPPATITLDGVYQIDACPLSFAVILNWLRYRHLMLGQEAEANSKVLTCMEDGVDRLEDVLQQLQGELGGMQDKMDDMKIEVAGVATGLEDLWRIKCEVANIASIMK